jgi:hypothetical protein
MKSIIKMAYAANIKFPFQIEIFLSLAMVFHSPLNASFSTAKVRSYKAIVGQT